MLKKKTTIHDLGPDLLEIILEEVISNPCRTFDRREIRKLKTSSYAATSKLFKSLIERHTFRSLSFDSTEPIFPRIDLDRIHAIKSLAFEIVVPDFTVLRHPPVAEDMDPELDLNKEARNKRFNECLEDFFRWLTIIDAEDGAPIKLSLTVQRPGHPFEKLCSLSGLHICFEDMIFAKSHLYLRWSARKGMELPLLNRPYELELNCRLSDAQIEPLSLAKLAARFTKLEKLYLSFSDEAGAYPEERAERRFRFARFLGETSFPQLKELYLQPWSATPADEAVQAPTALLYPGQDYFSMGIHMLSQQLTILRLDRRCTVSPALFWPHNGITSRPYWPSIRIFHVEFDAVTPEGEWRYDGTTPVRVDEPSHRNPSDFERKAREFAVRSGRFPQVEIRTRPISEKLTPMFLAATRAASQMPRLQIMDIRSRRLCNGSANRMLFIERGAKLQKILSGGIKLDTVHKSGIQDKPTIYWSIYDGYDPSEVNALWAELTWQGKALDVRNTQEMDILGRSELEKLAKANVDLDA